MRITENVQEVLGETHTHTHYKTQSSPYWEFVVHCFLRERFKHMVDSLAEVKGPSQYLPTFGWALLYIHERL